MTIPVLSQLRKAFTGSDPLVRAVDLPVYVSSGNSFPSSPFSGQLHIFTASATGLTWQDISGTALTTAASGNVGRYSGSVWVKVGTLEESSGYVVLSATGQSVGAGNLIRNGDKLYLAKAAASGITNTSDLTGSNYIEIGGGSGSGWTIAASAPASPTNGMGWYDTVNDVLKIYNGSSWDTIGPFPLASALGALTDFTGALQDSSDRIIFLDGSDSNKPKRFTIGRLVANLPDGSSLTSSGGKLSVKDAGVGKAKLGADVPVDRGAYSASSTYIVGDIVTHSGDVYRCKTAIDTAESFTSSKWDNLSEDNPTLPDKASNTDIDGETDNSDYVTVAGVFRAIARKVKSASTTVAGIIEIATSTEADTGSDTSTAMTPALVKQRIEAQPRDRGAYSSSSTYRVGDLVTQSSNVYRCKTAIDTAETFTASKWDNLTASGGGNSLTDAQIGDKAFSNPPSDLTTAEKTSVRTAIGAGTGSGQSLTDSQIGDKAFSNPPSDLTTTEKTSARTTIGAGTSSQNLTDAQIGDKAFSNPPSDLSAAEKGP